MDQATAPELSNCEGKSGRLFFLGGSHSRNSSVGSVMSDEVELLPTPVKALPAKGSGKEVGDGGSSRRCCKVTGSCMCKLSVVFYLAACILVSALYVAFFGKNQAFFGDAWIPGKPTVHEKPTPTLPHYFEDLPYTEWVSQRWTYHDAAFSDWPTLPAEVDSMQQLVAGKMGGASGLWLLTESQLFFVHGLNGGRPERVEFVNVSQHLDIEVTEDSYMAPKLDSSLYLFSTYNVTYLDCSRQQCRISGSSCDLLPFDTVLTSCYSLSDDTLWLGTTEGLFTVSHQQNGCLIFTNISQVVEEPVRTLAWRSGISDGSSSRHPTFKPFFFDPTVENHLQEIFASSSSHGTQWTGSYWSQKRSEHQFGVLVVGTEDRLYFHDGRRWWFEWISTAGLGALLDGVPTALTFGPSGELYVTSNASLTRVNINYTFDRIGALQGLPYNQLTSLHVSTYCPSYPPLVGPAPPSSLVGTLWVGTAKGYTLFDIQRSEFLGYYNGPRWLPGETVLDMAKSGSAVVLLTQQGLGVVYPEAWTLAMKARHYQSMVQRHVRPPGLVLDSLPLGHTPPTCVPPSSEGDSLATAWLLTAEALKYEVTRDPLAKELAWELFSGLKFLVNVTGVPGLMAHSVASENCSVKGGSWHESSSVAGWQWQGGSRDTDVLAHMWTYPLVYDMLALDQEQKGEVEEALRSIVDHIKVNQYQLTDGGNVTTPTMPWEVWSPLQLNLNQSWASRRGPSSLQILSYLLSAYRITDSQEYCKAWKELFEGKYADVPTHYGLNIVNQRVTMPFEGSSSEDELAFLPYFLYYYSLERLDKRQRSELGEKCKQFADLSVRRAWRAVSRTRGSAWTAIFAYITGNVHDPGLLEELVWSLRKWPLELVQWDTHNSHRLDVTLDPEHRLHGVGVRSVQVLPANERTQFRWSQDPFLLDSRGGNGLEADPGAWLLPYWLARWSGML